MSELELYLNSLNVALEQLYLITKNRPAVADNIPDLVTVQEEVLERMPFWVKAILKEEEQCQL